MLKDRKTVTENDLHVLVQAFQSQPNTAYDNMTIPKKCDSLSKMT